MAKRISPKLLSQVMAALGSRKSAAKTAAARLNGQRPKKPRAKG